MRSERIPTVLLVGLVLASFWGTLSSPFLSDDFVHLHLARVFHWSDVERLMTTAGGDGFFRPAGYIYFGLIARWAGVNPAGWHLASLALHTVNCILLMRLAIRLGWRPWAAVVAAAVFGIHGTRPEAAVWTAGAFDLLATLFLLSSLVLFLQHLRTGAPLPLAVSLAAAVMALLSKESAFVQPLLLLMMLFLGEPSRRACLRVVPFAILTIAVFSWRWHLLGGIGGYGDPRTGEAQALTFGVGSTLKVLLMRLWGPIYFPINWSVQPGAWLGGMTLLAVPAYVTLALAWIDRHKAAFAVGFLLVAALPACHQLLISASLEKSRLLYMPSIGFSLLIGIAIQGIPKEFIRVTAAAALLLFYSVALHHNLKIWERVALLTDQTCRQAARATAKSKAEIVAANLPGSIDGVYFLRNGLQECIELYSGRRVSVVKAGGRKGLAFRWDASEQRLVVVD